ncbi:hypothetical protein PP707_02440, partial [Acetobacter pasteurianus]|nr:hypothetical protein [Acetobacter pasteurianus]
PVEDLREHHAAIKKKEEAELKSSPFHRIPPELAYLEKKNAAPPPKPVDASQQQDTKKTKQKQLRPNSHFRLSDLPDLSKLKFFDVKDISVQNKETELQFHYTTIDLPPSSDSVIVDVKYSSLNSFDLSKINQYLMNFSNVKVGLGYEFAGVITNVGSSTGKKYAVGDFVFGMIDPSSRRGALSTSQLVYPGRDVLIKVDEETMKKIEKVDINLIGVEQNKQFKVDDGEDEQEQAQAQEQGQEQGQVEADGDEGLDNVTSQVGQLSLNEDMPPLAKLSAISLLYNRAKQMLQYLNKKSKSANILINGGDTNIGITVTQILLSQYPNLDYINLILVIRDKSQSYMEQLVAYFNKKYYDPSRTKRIKCITFDMFNDGLFFPGERVPVAYKKPDFFATEVIDALLVPRDSQQLINESNINDYKLDLFIDLIGCKKYFQSTSTKLHEIESLNLPFKQNILVSIEKLFQGSTKLPFLTRILKPKKYGSVVVSGCKFYLREPSYNIDKLIDFTEQGVTNPWTKGWTSSLLNTWTTYYYYEEIYLKIKPSWCQEALQLVLDEQLKFKVDHIIDWRKDYKKYVKQLREDDGKVVFKVEDF